MPDVLDAPMFPRLQLPTEGELSPSEINSLISTANTIRKIDLESRAAARRYRGQQQLQALIGQGVPMDQAMQRVAGDLFYNDASGFLSYRNAEENRKLRELTQKRLEQQAAAMDLHRAILEQQGQERIGLMRTGAERQSAAESTAQKNTWMSDYRTAKTAHAKAARTLAAYDASPARQFDKELKAPGAIDPRLALATEERSAREDLERLRKQGQAQKWYLPEEKSEPPPGPATGEPITPPGPLPDQTGPLSMTTESMTKTANALPIHSKAELVKGQRYEVPGKGVWTWDGNQFVR